MRVKRYGPNEVMQDDGGPESGGRSEEAAACLEEEKSEGENAEAL